MSILSACSSFQTAFYEELAYDYTEAAALHLDQIVCSVGAMSMTLKLFFRLYNGKFKSLKYLQLLIKLLNLRHQVLYVFVFLSQFLILLVRVNFERFDSLIRLRVNLLILLRILSLGLLKSSDSYLRLVELFCLLS